MMMQKVIFSRKRINGFWLLVILFTSVCSCKPTVPGEYIQPDELEEILYDYHLSQAMAYQRNTDGEYIFGNAPIYTRNYLYYAVLKKHGITEAEFDSSLVYYYNRADKLHKIYSHISERMEKEALGLGANIGAISQYSQYSADGDTANIWKENNSALLTPAAPYNRLDFKIECDSTFKKGDSFLFNFMADFIYQGGTKDAILYIAVKYDNDSISTHFTRISVSGLSQLRIPGCSDKIKEIQGFIYLSKGNDDSNTLKLMFINQIQFIRFHSKEQQENQEDTNAVIADSLKRIEEGNILQETIRPVKINPIRHDAQIRIQNKE